MDVDPVEHDRNVGVDLTEAGCVRLFRRGNWPASTASASKRLA